MAEPVSRYGYKYREEAKTSFPLINRYDMPFAQRPIPSARHEFTRGIGEYTALNNSDIGDSFNTAENTQDNINGFVGTTALLSAVKTRGASLVVGASTYLSGVVSDDSQIISDPKFDDEGRVAALDMHILPDTWSNMSVKTIRFEVDKDPKTDRSTLKIFNSPVIEGKSGYWFDSAAIPNLIESGSQAAQEVLLLGDSKAGSLNYEIRAAKLLADQIQREPDHKHFRNLSYLAATHLTSFDPKHNLNPEILEARQAIQRLYANALAQRKKDQGKEDFEYQLRHNHARSPGDFLEHALGVVEELEKPLQTSNLMQVDLVESKKQPDLVYSSDLASASDSPIKSSLIKFIKEEVDPKFNENSQQAKKGILPKAVKIKLDSHLNEHTTKDAWNLYTKFYRANRYDKNAPINEKEGSNSLVEAMDAYFGVTVDPGADGIVSYEEFKEAVGPEPAEPYVPLEDPSKGL